MMGFFSKLFASTNAAHTAHDAAANDAEAARQAQIKKIEALLDSVNSASQHVRNYYITFLLACFYIALIVWSTTDLMLLKNTPVTMPLLNVELPITGFYTFAPYFFLLLHFNLLLQFSLLADKTHRFDQAVIGLQDEDSRRYYYTRLFAFVLTQVLSAKHHAMQLRFLLTLMVWITVIWLPLGILIGLQVGFLPYHNEDILFWQRIAVMLDLLLLQIFWPMIRKPNDRWRNLVKYVVGLSWLLHTGRNVQPRPSLIKEPINLSSGYPVLEGIISLLTGFCVILFVWGIAVLPDSVHERNMRDWLQASAVSDWWQSRCKSEETDQHYFIATEWLFDGRYETTPAFIADKHCGQSNKKSVLHRNLVLREQLLIANELKAEDEADLKSSDEMTRQAVLKKVAALVLSGRDLRYADFSEARMPKVDFIGVNQMASNLSYANFSGAMLIAAQMDKVLLQGATLVGTKLQNASLNGAQFQHAWLNFAKFQDAKLNQAQFQEANLDGAQFQSAKLNEAQFQGAWLNEAEFQNADLNRAKFHDASLEGAQFQGAWLNNAEFQGARLERARFVNASLYQTKFQSAFLESAEFQGADLNSAQFQGANMKESNFTLANISGVEFGFLTQDEMFKIVAKVNEEIRDKALRQGVTDRLMNNVRSQKNVFAATGENIWDFDPMRVRLLGFWGGLKAAGDWVDYQNKLAEYWIELFCKDRWIVQGIIRHRINSDIAQCLLSLKDKKNQFNQLVCPAMSKVDDQALEILNITAAAKKNSDDTITSTFSCRTERSDPVSLTE